MLFDGIRESRNVERPVGQSLRPCLFVLTKSSRKFQFGTSLRTTEGLVMKNYIIIGCDMHDESMLLRIAFIYSFY
jgi:hypothetical protein